MTAEKDGRSQLVSLLRVLADLLEGNKTGRAFHSISVSFFPEAAQETQAIMTALPLPWKAGRADNEYQHLDGRAPGFDVTIFAKRADIGTQTGVREVPIWEPKPEIAALLAEPMRDES